MPIAIKVIIVLICSYFLGNITFARQLSRVVKDDITTHGSGNPGTMNMMRTYGPKLGFLTLLLDALKGFISCLCAYFIFGGKDGGQLSVLMEYIAGVCCFLGHIYPVIYKFKGGKGVATACGIALCINPLLMLGIGVFYFLFLLLCEMSGLTSMVSVVLFSAIHTVFICIDGYYWCLIPLYFIVGFVIFAHRSNIVRMINGNENKMAIRKIFKKKKKTENTSQSEQNVETENVEK